MRDFEALRKRIGEILTVPGDRVGKARRITAAVREAGGYRWVGLYDVAAEAIEVVAWSGPGAPAVPKFPADRGLCGAAVSSGATVSVGDVTKDPRYLTTLGDTRSEIVVPVVRASDGRVAGLIDVESERLDAFGAEDRRGLERCAETLRPLWGA